MSANEQTSTDFEEVLKDLDGGVYAQKIGRALSDVAMGAVMTGKAGKVTLTFDIKQIGESSQVEVAHKIAFMKPLEKGKCSEENTTSTPLHVGRGGKLTIFSADQGVLDFMKN